MYEDSYRRIAAEYIDQYGAGLLRELQALPQNESPRITPALDRRVRMGIAAFKRRRYTKITGLIAACLAFVLLVPSILRLYQGGSVTTSPEPAWSSAAEAPAPAPDTSPNYEILPLSFTLPDYFSVSAVEQDIEKTVYYLENSELDNVVMTMERHGDLSLFDGLTPVSISGHSAYGSSGNGYSLLAFEKQDVLYVLTCKHDVNTLVNLSENILI